MRKCIAIIIILMVFILNPTCSFAQLQALEEVKRLDLLYINCIETKSKKDSEKIRIEVVVDGYRPYPVLNTKLHKDSKTDLGSGYEFIDFAIVKIWDDNVFKDKLLSEVKIDRNNIEEFNTLKVNKNGIDIDIFYRLSNSDSYKNFIFKLRQDISELTRQKEELKDKMSELRESNYTLQHQNNLLRSQINLLRYRMYDMTDSPFLYRR